MRLNDGTPLATSQSWGSGDAELYASLAAAMRNPDRSQQDHNQQCAELLRLSQPWLPEPVYDGLAASACTVCQASNAEDQGEGAAANAFLYQLLNGDSNTERLHQLLAAKPAFVSEIAQEVFPGSEDAQQRLIDLVELAVRARPASESYSLLPARYHVFARALEGAFACLNLGGHADGNPTCVSWPP